VIIMRLGCTKSNVPALGATTLSPSFQPGLRSCVFRREYELEALVSWLKIELELFILLETRQEREK
jgi:hypothetical protein